MNIIGPDHIELDAEDRHALSYDYPAVALADFSLDGPASPWARFSELDARIRDFERREGWMNFVSGLCSPIVPGVNPYADHMQQLMECRADRERVMGIGHQIMMYEIERELGPGK
jgi:hypothetical protein